MITIADPIEADALRIRHEFLQTPDLELTVPQVAALLGVSMVHASDLLRTLEREGFLKSRVESRESIIEPSWVFGRRA